MSGHIWVSETIMHEDIDHAIARPSGPWKRSALNTSDQPEEMNTMINNGQGWPGTPQPPTLFLTRSEATAWGGNFRGAVVQETDMCRWQAPSGGFTMHAPCGCDWGVPALATCNATMSEILGVGTLRAAGDPKQPGDTGARHDSLGWWSLQPGWEPARHGAPAGSLSCVAIWEKTQLLLLGPLPRPA